MDDRYYTEEINYLLEEGKEFARQHPQKARMLHLDDIRSRDPNVERLIESFAFLTSRIRKRLDDDFSKIADGLFSLMWPGYLNPVPSFCLLEFRPQLWDFKEAIIVPAGAEIDSDLTDAGMRCRFRTCFDAPVLPLDLVKVSTKSQGSTSVLNLSFEFASGAVLSSLADHLLRLQIFGEFSHCWQLYNLLLGVSGKVSNIKKLEMRAYNGSKEPEGSWTFGPEVVSPAGLTKEESLLPMEKTVLWSFGLIRDFFIFPEKFQSVNFDVLKPLAAQAQLTGFDLAVHLSSPWPSSFRISKDYLRVNTVPIVNLFSHDANPIRLDRLKHQYTVRGDLKNPEYYQVFSVNAVDAIEVGTGKRKIYKPLYTSGTSTSSSLDENVYYCLERSRASFGGLETYITFVDNGSQAEFPDEEVLSLSLTCTNGRLTNQLLPGQINDPVADIDDSLRPGNISHPTQFQLPNIENNSLWRWLSHASLNYLSLSSVRQFKSLLELHDLSHSEVNRHKIEGIKSINLRSSRTLFQSALVPGITVEIVVSEEHFSDEGEIQLLARVLAAFMSSYASINSYIQLTLITEPSNIKISILPRLGENLQL